MDWPLPLKGTTPLLSAASGGHVEVCKLLLDSGANIFSESDEGDTLLHVAASLGGHFEAENESENKTRQKKKKRREKDSPRGLHREGSGAGLPLRVLGYGYVAACKLLMDRDFGYDIDAKEDGKNNNGFAAVHHAAVKGRASTLEKLADLGADFGAIDKHGQSAFALATKKLQSACLEVISRRAPEYGDGERATVAPRG